MNHLPWMRRMPANLLLPSKQPLRNSVNPDTLWLYDAIGADMWGGVSAEDFARTLQAMSAPKLHLRINSPGGDITDARAMVTALREHPSHITAHIDGLAASAASYVALACDEVVISEGAFVMVHNAWTLAAGNRFDMQASSEMLAKIDHSIAADYQRKTGKDEAQVRAWMDAETWFSAQEALEVGLVDRIACAAFKPQERPCYDRLQDRLRTLSAIERIA